MLPFKDTSEMKDNLESHKHDTYKTISQMDKNILINY